MGLLFLPIPLALNFSECFLFSTNKEWGNKRTGRQTDGRTEIVALFLWITTAIPLTLTPLWRSSFITFILVSRSLRVLRSPEVLLRWCWSVIFIPLETWCTLKQVDAKVPICLPRYWSTIFLARSYLTAGVCKMYSGQLGKKEFFCPCDFEKLRTLQSRTLTFWSLIDHSDR